MKNYQLEDLYKKYAKPLYYFLWKMSGSAHVAEDLTQETFVRATVSLYTYDGEKARAWLFKVARNVYVDEWRKRKRRQAIPLLNLLHSKEDMISPYGLPEEAALNQELSSDLAELIGFLPEHYRTILYLREFEQFSYKEIQETLDLTEDQVKVNLYRARKKLEALAEKKGWHDDGVE
ncbi:sigma-70 family RNA polymerase sigma factor [Planococcus salinus]|uniref:Sigma-70 family RNA polymerase sigma factor n=1 Tax=Planococcus salinus TaxID=1848460 RepID=A0A3M8P849_9BACL|nr:sigma-70 family RNA polymerase sigma factor [Planococcus salinus]RNF39384.1 sigma-70 family RNA polymerase sigma factor [Planococcus salinus]